MRTLDGTIMQSGLSSNPDDYEDERICYPVVGIVLNVRFSDDPTNATAIPNSSQRGYVATCDVLVTSSGSDKPWIIPNAIIVPRGRSGIIDFSEDLPRPCSQTIDGSKFATSGVQDYSLLDGDYCVVEFIGGALTQPFMVCWWPHPGNNFDPATLGFKLSPKPTSGSDDPGNLVQGPRTVRRISGTTFAVTPEGSFYMDTSGANEEVTGSSSGVQRKKREVGGDIQIDIKPERKVQFNWNPVVDLPDDQPSLLQPNPPSGPQEDRGTDDTAITFNKSLIEAIAGEVIRLITNEKNIEIQAKTKVTVVGEDGDDSVILGSTDTSKCDHCVNGETFLEKRFDTFVQAFNDHLKDYKKHIHLTSVGPSDATTDTSQSNDADKHTSADLSPAVMVVKS